MNSEKEPVFVIVLAHSGGRVRIPDGVSISDEDESPAVDVLDKDGRVLVTFQRGDVAVYGMDNCLPDCLS